MTRPKTVIQQKITELTKQVAHFEQCIQTAKQHIHTLEKQKLTPQGNLIGLKGAEYKKNQLS